MPDRTIQINSLAELKIFYKSHNEKWIGDIMTSWEEWQDKSEHIDILTSGSTGQPKLIKLSKSSMRESALKTNAFFEIPTNAKALLCLPADRIAGKMMIVRSLVLGWELLISKPSFSPLNYLHESIDFVAMTPYQINYCIENDLEKIALIDILLIGGGVVSSELEIKLKKIPCHCWQSFGMTETITHIAARKLGKDGYKSPYQAMPGVRFGITPDNCLLVKADHLEHEVITNDLVTLIDEQSFYWSGRSDFAINSGGIKILPEVVEEKLSTLLRNRYFISSLPDENLGQKCILIVEGKLQIQKNNQELWRQISNRLDRYEIPKKIYFVDHFEETKNGKIRRDLCLYKLDNFSNKV